MTPTFVSLYCYSRGVFLFGFSTQLAQIIACVISEQQNKTQSNNPLEQQ